MPLFYTFRDETLPPLAAAGGKGLSLLKAHLAGFNVPPAAVLSTAFFQPWLEQLKGTPEWSAFALQGGSGRQAAAPALKRRSLELDFTTQQEQAFSAALEALGLEGHSLLAVRSSSPQEDLEGASFAGIYETVLGVRRSDLHAAILTCFASALDERVVAYKQEKGFDPLDPRIAVVIQLQVPAEVSGVAFSLNPVSNCYDECVINANFGLGETVVDGTITPDQFIVDKVSGAILKKAAGEKHSACYIKAGGGSETRTPSNPYAFCLDDPQAHEIMELTGRVESVYGRPVDIEWAYAGGQLYLLQARPITTWYRLPDEMVTQPGAQKNLYHDANLTEQGLPEDMSPLGEEVFVRGSSMMMEVLGADPNIATVERGLLFGAAGRTYSHIGRMVKLMGKKNVINTFRIVDDYGTRILAEMDLKEYIPKKLPRGLMLNFLRSALGGIKIVRPMLRAGRDPEAYLQYYLTENARLRAALKAHYEQPGPFRDFYDFAVLAVSKHISFIGLPAVMATERARGKIKKLLARQPEAVQEHLHHIEQAYPNNVTIEMGLLLYELSQFPDVQQTATAQEFVRKLQADELSPEFIRKWDQYMENYGMRCPKEADIATPRYYENPAEVFTLLKSMGTYADPGQTPPARFQKAMQQRLESVRYLENLLATQSRRKARIFKQKVRVLAAFVPYRETPKYYMIVAVDLMRRRALALAEKWVAAGRLERVEQIFDLEVDDITRAEADPKLDILSIAGANRAYIDQFNPLNDPPVLIDSRGYIPTLPPRALNENEFIGTPVSHGVVRGRVKLLLRADEKPVLPGEILVTKATDPGWTTLFLNAGGVLLESGGTLQHGASVARETGLPCIVGLHGITRRLKDGQLVEMDGSTGVVRLLE